MMKSFKLLMAVGTVCASISAQAGGLFAPFSMDSASVMPKGVRSVRLAGFTTEIGDKYNGWGSTQPLANSFNKKVTWRELIDSQPAGFERGKFKGGLESLGLNLDSEAGESRGIINTRVTSTIPVFAYGLTEQLTVAVALPVLYSNVNVSTGWAANEDFQNKLDMVSQKGFHNQALSYDEKLQNVVATKILGKGYRMPTDEKRTDIGDLTIGAKYQVFKAREVAVAVSPKVAAPTGRTADVDKLVDIASGDGQWDLGVSSVVDYSPISDLTLTTGAGYTYQVANVRAMRIPESSEESLTADVDPGVHQKLGNVMSASLGARYKLTRLVTAGTAYSLQYKEQDSYTGGTYAPERYAYLAEDTEQMMQAGQVGLSFSTVPLYTAKQFDVPLDASLSYSSVFDGHNVNKIDLWSAELVAYF